MDTDPGASAAGACVGTIAAGAIDLGVAVGAGIGSSEKMPQATVDSKAMTTAVIVADEING